MTENERRMRIGEMRKSIESEKFSSKTFRDDDQSDPKTGAKLRKYVENWAEVKKNNLGLMFHGDVGGGKTFWAACVANALIEKEVDDGAWKSPVWMTTVQKLRWGMQQNFEKDKARILRQITETQLLILDDFGFEKETKTANESLFEIVDQRYMAGRPLIVTTNLTLDEIRFEQDMARRRVYDRIIEMCSTPVYISANGRRQKIAREKSEALRKILDI